MVNRSTMREEIKEWKRRKKEKEEREEAIVEKHETLLTRWRKYGNFQCQGCSLADRINTVRTPSQEFIISDPLESRSSLISETNDAWDLNEMAAYLDSSYPLWRIKKKEEREEGFEEGFLRSSNSLTTVNEEIEKEINAFRSRISHDDPCNW